MGYTREKASLADFLHWTACAGVRRESTVARLGKGAESR